MDSEAENDNKPANLIHSEAENDNRQIDLIASDNEFTFPSNLLSYGISLIQHVDSVYSDEDDYDGDDNTKINNDNDDNDVIIISSEEEGENRNVHPILNHMLDFIAESPEYISNSLASYTLVRSAITVASRPIQTSTSRSTQTSTSRSTTTTTSSSAAAMITTTEPLQQCCICLIDIT